MAHLPVEIINDILSSLVALHPLDRAFPRQARYDCYLDLCNAALISRQWTDAARQQLFGHFTYHWRGGSAPRLLQTFEDSPHLYEHVRELTVYYTTQEEWFSEWNQSDARADLDLSISGRSTAEYSRYMNQAEKAALESAGDEEWLDNGSSARRKGSNMFWIFVSNLPNLRTLAVEDMDSPSSNETLHIRLKPVLSGLTRFSFSSEMSYWDHLTIIHYLTSVEMLYLNISEKTYIQPRPSFVAVAASAVNASLRYLRMDCLNTATIANLGLCLTNLVGLDLPYIGDDSFSKTITLLPSLKTLRYLSINPGRFSPGPLVYDQLCEALENLSITHLHLNSFLAIPQLRHLPSSIEVLDLNGAGATSKMSPSEVRAVSDWRKVYFPALQKVTLARPGTGYRAVNLSTGELHDPMPWWTSTMETAAAREATGFLLQFRNYCEGPEELPGAWFLSFSDGFLAGQGRWDEPSVTVKTAKAAAARKDALVRIPWETDTWIEAFLWRTADSYERGWSDAWEMEQAEREGREAVPDPASDPKTFENDLQHYRILESKLGNDCHTWDGFAIFDDPATMPEEFISTAYFSVALPPVLDVSLGDLSDTPLSANDTCQIVLDVMFELISKRYGRHAFKFWPPGVPLPTTSTKEIPDAVLKYRVFSWLLDVAAFYLRKAKPTHETIVSSVLLRILKPIQPMVSDNKISLVDFEKQALLSIGRETVRSKTAYSLLGKVAIPRILERPVPKDAAGFLASKTKRPLLHIVTLGFSPATFTILRELVHYLLTISSHPYSSLTPGASTMSKDQEKEWLSRPNLLRITIAESRPSCEGVALARQIHQVVEASAERARQLRDLSRSYAHPTSVRHAPPRTPLPGSSPEVERTPMPSGLIDRLKKNKASGSTGITGAYGTLGDLLQQVDHQSVPDGATKVTIDIIPDAALASTILEAGSQVVVLIGAERILPGEANVVAKIGSYVAAWTAKEVKAKVFVLATSDAIECAQKDKKPPMIMGSGKEVTGAWKEAGAAKFEGLEGFVGQVLDEGNEGVKVVCPESEIVPAKFVDAWITDAGILSAVQCCKLGKERGEAEALLYGKS
ncbi:hypothetical protein P7C70_g1436, partial [Phenoliferia sp. Uapishka_3]